MIIIHHILPNYKGESISMTRSKSRRWFFYIALPAVILLILIGITMLWQTFKEYNVLSLRRQDNHLQEMAQAVDAYMTAQLTNLRDNLRYIIDRRKFLEAENRWHTSGSTESILDRMQENLVVGNPLIDSMLAIQGDEIVLSTAGMLNYYFPEGMSSPLSPCFAADGTVYLAIIEEGQHARYAALVSMSAWYADVTKTYVGDDFHLMLLGSQRRILLHTWQGRQQFHLVETLTADNSDFQAALYMTQDPAVSSSTTFSYNLTYPGDSYEHEMRMTVIPFKDCSNGCFSVGLISDYDEILVPVHAAIWRFFFSGALIMTGMLLLLLTSIRLLRQNRRRDQELERLTHLNYETQKLLESTKELAHHQRLETIGTLTASIAHEFNNLLTPIMGYSILTLEGLPNECGDLADNIAQIYEASRKAKDIITRLNELSRKSNETDFIPIALRSIAAKAMQVAAHAQPPRVSDRFLCTEEDVIVSGNETQLSQMMLNLILNAYHAMESQGGCLTLSLNKEGNEAVLLVQDEGVGIAPEALPHIFDPFFTTKESGRGTGLGLAIVQQVVQIHHGSIAVESTPGAGTLFTLRFPLADTRRISIY